jgi:cell division protein FtsQ
MDMIKVKQASKLIFLSVIVIGFVAALNHLSLSRYFPIKTVRVYGVSRVDHALIKKTITPLIERGFFSINVDYIRDRLLQMPWVSDISVRRAWPDQLEVTVVERSAIATWNEADLLSDGGEVFSPTEESYPAGLPTLHGPDGQQMLVLQYFNQMNRLLQPIHASIAGLELTPYLTWKLTLDNGIKMQFGHKDVLTRLDHFVRVYPKIVGEHAADVDYIDLRYPNGAAVRWKRTVKI